MNKEGDIKGATAACDCGIPFEEPDRAALESRYHGECEFESRRTFSFHNYLLGKNECQLRFFYAVMNELGRATESR